MNTQSSSDYQHVQHAIAYLADRKPGEIDFDAFAKSLGCTKRQLGDLFQRWCGLSPKSFVQAVALDHAKNLLADNASVLDTTYEIGMSSTSRLHDLFVTYQAMPPGIWAKRGEGLTMRWGIVACPFGLAIVFATDYGIAGIGFVDEKGEAAAYLDLANRWPAATYVRDESFVSPLASQVFDPQLWNPEQPVRLVMIGSNFEVKVWETLLKIPMGAATTYGKLANKIGKPKAARAVGSAVGRNPISFVVPCHRVVGASGELTGYHWGIMRKRAILGWETGVAGEKLSTN